MRSLFLNFALIFSITHSFCQSTEEQDDGTDHFIDNISLNPIRSFANEVIFHFKSYDNRFIKGFMFGVIHPNKPLFDLFGEGYVAYGDSEYQLNVGKWGIGSGVKLNPFHHKNWSLNTLFRYSFANSVTDNEYVHTLGTYGINLDHQSFSTNINLEGSFSFDFYRGKKKSKAVNQFYFGCGGKLLYHKTDYNYTVQYSFQPEGRHDVNRDNGWFVVPTAHLGYRIGIDL